MGNSREHNTCVLTIGETTYKTSGNILFSDCDPAEYMIAESKALEKLDKAIQHGILENGMQMLLRRVKS
ncbi:MAG: hypothetical protein WCW67_00770 [Candidatus Margulisiibacteriota bacterium]